MPKKVTPEQRQQVLRMLAEGQDRETIAAAVQVTTGQVSAIAAHVSIGTCRLPEPGERGREPKPDWAPTSRNVLDNFRRLEAGERRRGSLAPTLLGGDAGIVWHACWNPDSTSATANRHVLIFGESEMRKTYTTCCPAAALARQGVVSIIFHYWEGLSLGGLPPELVAATDAIELHAGSDGVEINPHQILASELHEPVAKAYVKESVAGAFTAPILLSTRIGGAR
jgi:hypothetical protein